MHLQDSLYKMYDEHDTCERDDLQQKLKSDAGIVISLGTPRNSRVKESVSGKSNMWLNSKVPSSKFHVSSSKFGINHASQIRTSPSSVTAAPPPSARSAAVATMAQSTARLTLSCCKLVRSSTVATSRGELPAGRLANKSPNRLCIQVLV